MMKPTFVVTAGLQQLQLDKGLALVDIIQQLHLCALHTPLAVHGASLTDRRLLTAVVQCKLEWPLKDMQHIGERMDAGGCSKLRCQTKCGWNSSVRWPTLSTGLLLRFQRNCSSDRLSAHLQRPKRALYKQQHDEVFSVHSSQVSCLSKQACLAASAAQTSTSACRASR